MRLNAVIVAASAAVFMSLVVPSRASADPLIPALTISPSSAVTDGQTITVQVTGFPAGQGQSVVLDECTTMTDDPVSSPVGDCNSQTAFASPVLLNSAGNAQVTGKISEAGCRTSNLDYPDCQIVGFDRPTGGESDVFETSAPLMFAPPTMSISPKAPYVDDEILDVTVTGFENEASIDVSEFSLGGTVANVSTTTNSAGIARVGLALRATGTAPAFVTATGPAPTLGYYTLQVRLGKVAADVLPGVPRKLIASATIDSVSVTWKPPAGQTQPLSWYVATRSGKDASGVSSETQYLSPDATSVIFTGLLPGAHYAVAVHAVNLDGNAGAQATVAIQTSLIAVNVTVGASTRTLTSGQSLTISGAVRPVHKCLIQVEQYRHGRWVAKSADVTNGRYRVKIEPTVATTTVRVVALKSEGYKSGISPSIKVKVKPKHKHDHSNHDH